MIGGFFILLLLKLYFLVEAAGSPEGLSMAKKAVEKFLARAVRLYEQEQGESFGSPLLGLYVRRWERWVNAGLNNINLPAR